MSSAASVGGIAKRFDYYSEYSRFQTDNDVPNNAYRNATYAGRFGVALGSGTDVSGTIRRTNTKFGSPGALTLQALREKIGNDDTFFTLLRTWYGENRYSNVTTGDFIELAERKSGQQLDQFFQAWLFEEGRPDSW